MSLDKHTENLELQKFLIFKLEKKQKNFDINFPIDFRFCFSNHDNKKMDKMFMFWR